jgi:hypothetical protein
LPPLYFISSSLILIWLIAVFVFDKGGFVHTLLFAAVAMFVSQFAAERRAAHGRRNDGL